MPQPVSYSEQDMKRYGVIQQTVVAALSTAVAAKMLNLSRRQVFRLKASVRRRGVDGVRHGNHGRTPANAKPRHLQQRVIGIYRKDCFDFNFAHFTETLTEEFAIHLSRETVRCWLRAEDLGPKQHPGHHHRRRREREAQFGTMLFLDGSPHLWLGPDLPMLTLMLSTDDATGRPLAGLFAPQETRDACFEVLYHVFRRYGLPNRMYLDRASQFTTTRHGGTHRFQRDDQPTSFEAAMDRLAVQLIFAHTPQARGRGERINGSFQGRLVAELRRAGIKTAAAATDYLNRIFIPKYVSRFGAKPRNPVPAFRKPPPGVDLRTILCAHNRRNVDNDNTITLNAVHYQLLPTRRTSQLAATDVDVQEWFDGTVHVFHSRSGEVPVRILPVRPTDVQTNQSTPYDISALQGV
jgi:transposase